MIARPIQLLNHTRIYSVFQLLINIFSLLAYMNRILISILIMFKQDFVLIVASQTLRNITTF